MTPGTRLYCIGDIHGRADLLERLHAMILADAAGHEGTLRVVYLGDYVDRGDQSCEVLDILLNRPLPGFDRIHLRGNHEQAMLDFLDYPDQTAGWLSYGGLATLLSYDMRLERLPLTGDLSQVAGRLAEKLPAAHRDFLAGLPLSHREGSYCFVHAGIRPGLALERQHPDDLLWIRGDFTAHSGPHECIVVHGHTISDEVEMLPHRIGLDTGAFVSGVLSCLVLENDQQRLLQTR